MFSRRLVCILLVVVLAAAETSILNLPRGFAPADESEYATYLEVMLGHYVESASTPESIKALISSERPSLLTAPEKVVLLLATLNKQDVGSQEEAALEVKGAQLRRLVQKYHSVFEVKVMLNVDREALQQTISELQSQGSLVNAIVDGEKAIGELERVLSQQMVANAKRRLQEPSQGTTDNTYLIKFFFSLVFILVIVACVGFISANDGKKDTLLYAKFIADVGAR